jgi:PTH2 family peptidyl-tRNA hydrolase
MQSYLINWLRDMRADPQAQKNLAFAITLALVCFTMGYLIADASSGGLVDSSKEDPDAAQGTKKSWPNSYDVKIHTDSGDEEAGAPGSDEEDEDAEGDGKELKSFEDTADEVKLVLVVRTDLNMGKGKPWSRHQAAQHQHPCTLALSETNPLTSGHIGKIAAQASHATLACYKYLLSHAPSAPLLKRWERGGQAKIAVQVKSEEELLTLQAQAMSLGLCARVIQDAGRTQIAAGSTTVLGILGPKQVVDQVTGPLKLL